jgi:Zn finger protein HypA/HybF involved in hydrogenase expression
MAQEPAGDGRHVSVTVRLTGVEAAEIDAVRGKVSRGTWLRDAALAAVRPAPKGNPKNCKHENMRLHRGYCPDCETMAVKR